MGVYTKAAREDGASASMALMRPRLALMAAAVVLAGASLAAYPGTPADITSLLGQPLVAPALAPEDEARIKAQLADAESRWATDRNDADALIWVGRRTAYLGRY